MKQLTFKKILGACTFGGFWLGFQMLSVSENQSCFVFRHTDVEDAVNVTKLLFLDAHQFICLLSLPKKREQEGHNVTCEMLSGI